jgi:hypothetical protein
MIGRFKNAAEKVLPQLCNIGFACEDHAQSATLLIIDGYYPDFDNLPAMQQRRDSIIGGFSLKHYLTDKTFFKSVLQKMATEHDVPITAVFLDDENEMACSIAFDGNIDVDQIIQQSALFATPVVRKRALTN